MKELKAQLVSALLVILTVAALISAGINFQQQKKFHLPEDGVTWVDRPSGVEALYVAEDSPADRAGIQPGDIVRSINGVSAERATDVARVLIRVGSWKKAEYLIHRRGVEVKVPVIVGERVISPALYYQYVVGLAYLAIGLFVYFRRGNAQKATHFYILCLASFVLSTFHYTGKLNNFDKVMYWGNVAAGLAAPTIFVHFCLTFPDPRRWLRGKGGAAVLYLPAAALMALYVGVTSGTLRVSISPGELRWLLDRVWLAYLGCMYAGGALLLDREYRRADDLIVRQQLKWLRNGTLFGLLPFVLLYVVPYALGAVPGPYMEMSVLALVIVPLTWAYAVLRYRLMDVDIVFQQGYAYTLATLCVLGLFYGLIFSLGKFEDLSPAAVVTLILIAAFAFQPIRSWIQEVLDKHYFYKDRYDYRRTLIEFARELSSETDLDTMLVSVADRLRRTLSVEEVGFFVAEEAAGPYRLRMGTWEGQVSARPSQTDSLDLGFLPRDPQGPYLFFERPRHPLDVLSRRYPASARRAIADLNLTYYVPCTVRGRTIAYMGVSRTDKGDFLSSDDVELLVTLSGYVGIAVENSRLYQSLQRKVEENERLKEFNQNIVESLNVGILAADLEDRVESWNSRMEQLTGIAREVAVGRTLSDLFPADLAAQFDRVREESDIHHITKYVLDTGWMPLPAAEAASPANGSRSNGKGPHDAAAAAPAQEGARETILNLAVAPLVARDDRRIGRLVIFDDVTDRAELERRLMQADKLSSIGLLAAGVAHEVNTPLAVISTYAQMLAKQIGGDEAKSVLLDKIAHQTFRASEIVNSLLNFSRTSSTEFDEVDLGHILRETLTLVEHQFEKAGIAIDLKLEEQLPAIRGNAGRLQQVFLNLYLNARDAMERGGTLGVRAWSGEEAVEVQVADTGKGIAPEDLHRIYDPFFTTKAAQKGTGLGLSVTYGIVREHGGTIEVQSRPGEGTQFRLEFPAVRKAVNA